MLAVFWKMYIGVSILSSNKNIIDVEVQVGKHKVFVSCIYGDPTESKRHLIWEKLSRIGMSRRSLLCMFGYFSTIKNNDEK